MSDAAEFGDTDGDTAGAATGETAGEIIELTMVTLRFDALDDAALLAVLSKYVVLARMHDGCRNIDLCSSVTVPGRHLVVQKWDSAEHQRRHFDSDVMVEMAQACVGLLSAPPEIDLWDPTSAHDLR